MSLADTPKELDWYLGSLLGFLLTKEVPTGTDVRLTEMVVYDASGLPIGVGRLFSVPEYRPRFAEDMARGWPWINLHALGVRNDVLLIAVETPSGPPTGAKATSVNMSGPSAAMRSRGFLLDGVTVDDGDAG